MFTDYDNKYILRDNLRMLDIINTLVTHQDKINPSEQDLANPKDIARLIVRRKIKEYFPSFTVRKNKEDYALRIDDDILFKIILLHSSAIGGHSIEDNLSEDLKAEFNNYYDSEDNVLSIINQSSGIRYDIKDENRIFIYVRFLPLNESVMIYNSDPQDLMGFKERSINKRIEKINEISEKLANIPQPTEYIGKLLSVITKFGIYPLTFDSMPLITRDLIDQALESETSNYRLFVRAYRERLRENESVDTKIEQPQQEEQSSEEDIEFEEIEEPSTRTTPRVPSIGPGRERTEEEIQAEFNAALRLVAERRRSREEQALTEDDEEHTDVFVSGRPPIHINHLNVHGELSSLSDEEETVLPVEKYNLTEDVDKEKDGLYYILKEGKTMYIVYKDNKIVYESRDLREANKKHQETFNKPSDEIKFYISEGKEVF